MNMIFPQRLSVLLGFTALVVVSSGLSAQAQTADSGNTENSTSKNLPNNAQSVPVPGTTATSTDALTPENPATRSPESAAQKPTSDVAQLQPSIKPGTVTRGGLNYLGVGGYIGTDTGFAVISKIGLTTDLSVRPSATIGDDVTFRIPLTYEFFPIPPGENITDSLRLTPYIGGGIVLTTDDDADVGAMIATGLDFPLGPQFTGNANVNIDFRDEVNAGVTVGFGYNFRGF